MKKVYENRGLFVLVYGAATAIMGFIIYPLLDLLMCKFITHSTFKYTLADHIISPLIFGFVFAFVYSFGMIKGKKKNEDK